MTDDNTTETEDQSGDETISGEGTKLVKDLRKQIKDQANQLKSVSSRSEIEAEIRAALAREDAIKSQLIALKQPAGLMETVEGKLEGSEVTREKVAEVLTAIGFEVSAQDDDGDDQSKTQQTAEDLAAVANLGNQVANAANQQTSDNLTDKINEAETPGEVARLMREAGLGQ